MAGRKQHFIPQSLLKGFGREGSGSKVQVVAFTFEHGIFPAATDGIGAARHFYSELSIAGEGDTLDDRITDHEQRFPETLAYFRGLSPDAQADTDLAAQFVTHLAVRNDHFRKSTSSAGAALIEGVADVLANEEQAQAFLGLDGDAPPDAFSEEMSKAWDQYGPLLKQIGFSEENFQQFAFIYAKENFTSFHKEMAGPLGSVLSGIATEVPSIAAKAHKRTLASDLSPPLRVERMKAYSWRVNHMDTLLILPDCVATAFGSDGKAVPLILADPDEVQIVTMPLSSHRLLVGSLNEDGELPHNINEHFARSSWDFFVAAERTSELERLHGQLRAGVLQFLSETLDEAMTEATANRLGGST